VLILLNLGDLLATESNPFSEQSHKGFGAVEARVVLPFFAPQ
jgi:hypothetical protein